MASHGQHEQTRTVRTPEELAADRLAFDKGVESRRSHLEESKLKQARVDTWTRFVGTIFVGILVTGGIQWYGIRNQEADRERSESAQQAQVAIQLANAREKALSDLRAQMFNALLQNYFKQADERERIAILELIGLNFRDAVQIKPMFRLLDAELRARAHTRDRLELEQALHKAAKTIIEDQLNQIRQAREGAVCRVGLTLGPPVSPECFPKLKIQLLKVDRSSIVVRTNSIDGALLEGAELKGGEEFTVNYFDMPMVDYTAVVSSSREPWRYSIVFYGAASEKKDAEIAVALLPVSAVGAQHRYAFDELLEKYLRPTIQH